MGHPVWFAKNDDDEGNDNSGAMYMSTIFSWMGDGYNTGRKGEFLRARPNGN